MRSFWKKTTAFLLAALLLTSLAACRKKEPDPGNDDGGTSGGVPITVYKVDGGEMGDSGLSWEISSDGTMVVRGNGKMPEYEYKSVEDSDLPWTPYLQGNVDNTLLIKKLVVEEGVSSISENAFYGCKNLTEVVLPVSLTEIAYSAFINCRRLTRVSGGIGLVRIEEMAFQNCTSLNMFSVSPSLAEVQTAAFSGCGTLMLLVTGSEAEWKQALEKMTVGEGNAAFVEATPRFYEVK